jgi:hypothetical protein
MAHQTGRRDRKDPLVVDVMTEGHRRDSSPAAGKVISTRARPGTIAVGSRSRSSGGGVRKHPALAQQEALSAL